MAWFQRQPYEKKNDLQIERTDTNNTVDENFESKSKHDYCNFNTAMNCCFENVCNKTWYCIAILDDEYDKDRKAVLRKCGWSKIWHRVDYYSLFIFDIIFTTLFDVADCYKFFIPACDEAFSYFKILIYKKKILWCQKCITFMKSNLVSVISNIQNEEEHIVVVMDNFSIHINHRVRELTEGSDVILLYSASWYEAYASAMFKLF